MHRRHFLATSLSAGMLAGAGATQAQREALHLIAQTGSTARRQGRAGAGGGAAPPQ
ncbi:MAG: hypothetical protein HY646_06600 [Acidobacteria bacterium]|nr:hypothetical protein [Acidobacteriota bacterium]